MKPLFLIADDSSAKRDFLRRFVQKQLDVQILFASCTEQTKNIVNEHIEIAAAFIDYEMPSEQGPAVIAYLKERNPNCHIALVTSADSAEYKRDAEEAGADEFICTGWELNRVEETLNTVLAKWKDSIEE
jgi:DNA-binding NarL/FixJ family response regulator